VTGTILGSRENLEGFEGELSGKEIAPSAGGARLLSDLEGFLERRVHRGAEAEKVEARGRRAILGLFGAYFSDPGLLDDHVLLRYKDLCGVPYFRDLPREIRDREASQRYRKDPCFTRLLADHLAAMTDGYVLAEFGRLLEIGAVPIPSVEQLLREEGR
jgi:dGTP triphosphohydrolase